jgi:F-type H+-transporting ATPase subunit epsilon
MPDNQLHLEIVTPDKVVFTDDVKSFTAPGVEGSFQILPRHAPFVSTIQPGRVKIVTSDGQEIILAASGGVVEVHQNKITFLAEAVEKKDEIDVSRAQQALERAQKKLAAREPGTNIVRAGEALARARNRLKIAAG